MSDQENKPTSGKTNKGKNTLSERILLDAREKKTNSATPATRRKPSVSNLKMRVDMPGELTSVGPKKSATPAAKPKPVARKQAAKELASSKKISKPKTSGKKTTSSVKASVAKRTTAPAKRKPVTRSTVVPPKIGSRRGYHPTLAFRLRYPVFLIAFVVCFLALFFTFRKEERPVGRYVPSALQENLVRLTIEPGMSARDVSLLLKEQGIVDDEVSLLQFFTDNNLATTLRSGTFVMEKGMGYEAIGRQLTAKVGEISIEVSPSFTLASIDRYLESRGYAKGGAFLSAAEALKEEQSLTFAEGWLLSGVYAVPAEGAASALVQAMFDAMLAVLQPYLGSEKVTEWGLEQTLIIASMIQAETQNVEEMPLISSVIYNRLEVGEPLGIDATTRYEIDDWENPIPVEALETKSPYNTRRKVGLPPSGICSPSKAAVEAALFPLESPYFYYLHGLDKHLYPAITYDEHKLNINAYR